MALGWQWCSDAHMAICLVSSPFLHTCECVIVLDIMELCKQMSYCSFHYMPRDSNRVAHSLVCFSMSCFSMHIYLPLLNKIDVLVSRKKIQLKRIFFEELQSKCNS